MACRGLASLLGSRRGGFRVGVGAHGGGGLRGLVSVSVPHCHLNSVRDSTSASVGALRWMSTKVRGNGSGVGGVSDEQRRKTLHAQVLAGVPRGKSAAAKAAAGDRPLLLDTHALVVALENSGMSRAQSAAIADALVAVSAAASQHARDQTVSKSAFSDLRAELSILEKADFAVLKGDIAGLYVYY